MNDDAPNPDTGTAPTARATKSPGKVDRLALALKANMARRKAQARARADGPTGEDAGPTGEDVGQPGEEKEQP